MLSPTMTGGRMGERREVEPLVATAEDARPLWFGSGLSTIRLDAGQTAGRLTVHEHVLPAGFQSPLHAHVEDDEVFYVLEGQLTAHLDGADERASTGDVILFPRGVPHAFRVESPTARILAVNTPAGHERFFRALSVPATERTLPPASRERPDPARLQAAAEEAGMRILGPPPWLA
jgi:quercetin dioxygenase-like cupin family protein